MYYNALMDLKNKTSRVDVACSRQKTHILEIGIYIATPLVLLVFVGALQKSLRLRFKSGWDEIWQDFSSTKYASIAGVEPHTFKMVAMTFARHSLLHMQQRPMQQRTPAAH